MGSSPQRQVFQTKIDFGIPATFVTQNDVLNALNGIPASVFDSALAGVLTVNQFLNRNVDVRSLTVSGSRWVQSSDHVHTLLQATITTISDPISAYDLAAIIIAVGALIVAAILFLFGPGGWAASVVIFALAAIGVLTLVAVTITEITQGLQVIGGNPILTGALVLVGLGAAVAGAGYLLRTPGAGRKIRSAGALAYSGARRGLAATRAHFRPQEEEYVYAG